MADDNRKHRPPRAVGRSSARLGAVQALYSMDLASADLADVLADFGSHRLGEEFDNGECGPADFPFLRDIVEGVVREQRTLDPKINENLSERWKLSRLDRTLRAILRAGAYELLFRKDVPVKVIINEYVEVAHAFHGGDEPGFVNKVLDGFARWARPEDFAA